MESAIYNGFKHHFPNLGRLLCVRHLSKRDESKLAKLLTKTNPNASQRNKSSSDIVKDIYGYRIGGYYEYGLAEVTDESDLDIKLLPLKEKWNGLCLFSMEEGMSYHSNVKNFLLKVQCGIPGQKKDEWITPKNVVNTYRQ